MHPLIQMLEDKRAHLQLTKRAFAVEYLKITEDSYSIWLRNFPSRLTNKSKENIANVLEMSIDTINELA